MTIQLNKKIRPSLYMGYYALFLISIFIGISLLYNLKTLNSESGLLDSSNHLVIMSLEARRQEKNFQLRGFEKFGNDEKNSAEKWQDWINSIYKETENLKAGVSDEKKIASITNIKKTTLKYETGFKEYISYKKNRENNPEKETSINISLVSSARIFQENCDELIKSQKALIAELTERILILVIAFFICILAAGGIILSQFLKMSKTEKSRKEYINSIAGE